MKIIVFLTKAMSSLLLGLTLLLVCSHHTLTAQQPTDTTAKTSLPTTTADSKPDPLWALSLQTGLNLATRSGLESSIVEVGFGLGFGVPPYLHIGATGWYNLSSKLYLTAEVAWLATETPFAHLANIAFRNRQNPLHPSYIGITRPFEQVPFIAETVVPISLGIRSVGDTFYAGAEVSVIVRHAMIQLRRPIQPDDPPETQKTFLSTIGGISPIVGCIVPLTDRLDLDINLRYTFLFTVNTGTITGSSPYTVYPLPVGVTPGLLRLSVGLRFH